MNVTIAVTQEHIGKGKPCEATNCPAYFAILDALPALDPLEVSVAQDYVALTPIVEVDLPPAARHWITDYDAGDSHGPFSFDLDIPDDLMAGATP